MTAQLVTVLGSEMRLVQSRHTGRQYRINIALPLGYSNPPEEGWPFNSTPSKWPVVYVLDGNWYFGLVTDMVRPTSWCGSITDAIVVGIGYPEGSDPIDAFRESFTRRNHDLTPVRVEAEEKSMEAQHKRPTPSGDAAGFLTFIRDELIPMIERDFRADPARRILVGHSYGGLFALYALLEAPGLFETLIIGSPTLPYGERAMFDREEAFSKAHTKLPAKVFLFVADLEERIDDTTLTDTLRLAAILEGRNYEGFSLVKRIFLGENHCEVIVPGLHAGLKMALKK